MQAPQAMQGHEPAYVDPASLPDMVAVLPAPPAVGSPQQAGDEATFRATRKLQGSARWALATRDADLKAASLADDFSCAVGARLTQASVPALFRIMDRAKEDAAVIYTRPKDHYGRQRPFVDNDEPICVARDSKLAANGSYPSGHTTIGESLALVLAEAAPEHATSILNRGRVFGESRVVCGVHWASDVEAGYLTASALVAALHSSAEFRGDVAALRDEIAKASGGPDGGTCQAEAEAVKGSVLFR
jgi:acid phosphatase (class A)